MIIVALAIWKCQPRKPPLCSIPRFPPARECGWLGGVGGASCDECLARFIALYGY